MIRALWEASLVQGAVADELTTTNDTYDGISGGSIQVHYADGTVEDFDASAGNVRSGQVFDRLGRTEQQHAATTIAATVTSAGLTFDSATFLTYRDDAVAVVVTVPPGSSFQELEALRVAITGSPMRYEGVYLELRDSGGKTLAISATAFRTGDGRLWVDPNVGGTFGAAHG